MMNQSKPRSWWRSAAMSAALLSTMCIAWAAPAPPNHVRDHVRRVELISWLYPVLDRLGDRFERPGKELSTFAARIGWGSVDASSGTPLEFTLEYPERINIRDTARNSVVQFDPAASSSQALSADDLSLIDSLFLSSVDHFFAAASGRAAVRAIGQQFASPSQTAAGTIPRYFDLYELAERSHSPGSPPRVIRIFCFDSASHELAVVYEPATNAETEYSAWRVFQNQLVPGRIVRRQNGAVVFTVDIQQAAFGAGASK